MHTTVVGQLAVGEMARPPWRWGWRAAILLLAALLGLLALSGCKYNQSEYRFRMTVEVETPDGIKTGSSVYEAGAADRVALTSEDAAGDLWSHGEAVAVEVAPGKVLFALLKTGAHFGDMATLSMEALDPGFSPHHDTVGSAARIAAGEGVTSPAVVDPAIYPMLVTFRNIEDPTSVELVDPDDLAASFGEGVKLKRITVQITDDPVTTGIEKRLGWLRPVGDERGSLVKNPPRLLKDATPRDLVSPGDFSSEIWK